MKHTTIGADWAGLESKVMPAGASATQRMESRRMFYCGYAAAMATMVEIPSVMSEREGLLAIKALSDELRVFFDKIDRGIA